MSDLDYDALRKVAGAATPGPWRSIPARDGLPAGLVAGGEVIADFDEDTRDATHAATFDPPTVLRLLDLAQRAEADRAAVEYDAREAENAIAALIEYANAETARAIAAEAAVERGRALADEWDEVAATSADHAAAREGLTDAAALMDFSAAMTRRADEIRAALDREADQ